MEKYIGVYNSLQDVHNAVDNEELLHPYVAYVAPNTIDYNGYNPTHDYSQDYLTILSLGDNNWIQFNSSVSDIYASVDNGQTWQSTDHVELNTGETALLKRTNTGSMTSLFSYIGDNINVYGNIMSLVYGDNFTGQTTIPSSNQFNSLFYNANKLIDASNLILPATTLAEFCYAGMFSRCVNMTSAPILPATTLVDSCYWIMFDGCSSLSSITCLGEINNGGTSGWVTDVASTGTFYKSPSMSSWTTGNDGIPSGWTVVDYQG